MGTVESINLIYRYSPVRGGRPCIVGTGLRVLDIVLQQRYGDDGEPQGIAKAYGRSLAEVYAALAYYHLHKAEIDADIQEGLDFDAKLVELGLDAAVEWLSEQPLHKAAWERRKEKNPVRTIESIDLIYRDPKVRGGRPCIVGTRLRVMDIVLQQRYGDSGAPQDVAAAYDITLGQVYAALAWYHENRHEIDGDIQEQLDFDEALEKAGLIANEDPVLL